MDDRTIEEVRNNETKLIKEIMELEQQLKKKIEVIDKAIEYINNYDVFKAFTLPLMKQWEEQEVKSSIDYELKISLIKDLKGILEDKEVK